MKPTTSATAAAIPPLMGPYNIAQSAIGINVKSILMYGVVTERNLKTMICSAISSPMVAMSRANDFLIINSPRSQIIYQQ
jgi:hypothetical protein